MTSNQNILDILLATNSLEKMNSSEELDYEADCEQVSRTNSTSINQLANETFDDDDDCCFLSNDRAQTSVNKQTEDDRDSNDDGFTLIRRSSDKKNSLKEKRAKPSFENRRVAEICLTDDSDNQGKIQTSKNYFSFF